MEKRLKPGDIASRRLIKRWAYCELEPAARTAPGLSVTNRVICILIIVSALFAILETEPQVVGTNVAVFLAIELAITSVFAVEYGLRVWVSSENPAFGSGALGYVRYALTPVAILDLLALAPIVFALVESHALLAGGEAFLLRAFRLLRILRLARLGRFSRAGRYLAAAIVSHRAELILSVGVAMLLILASSSLLYFVEGPGQPKDFGSIPRAMWWSVVTLTTVGYGDVTPATPLGRLLAGVTAVAGIGLIAMPAGILAAAFIEAARRQREETSDSKPSDWRPEQ